MERVSVELEADWKSGLPSRSVYRIQSRGTLFPGGCRQCLEIDFDHRSVGPQLIEVVHLSRFLIKEMEHDLTVVDAEPASVIATVNSQTRKV